MSAKINVMVVDDAAFMRKAVTDMLESDPGVQVVGTARNGLEGLEQIKKLRPDVVTMDMDMPVMDGLTSIRHIMIESPVPIVALSSLTRDGAVTFEALRLGVVDFVPKPSGAISADIGISKIKIIDRIKLAQSLNFNNIRRVRLPRWHTTEQLTEQYRYRPMDYVIAMGTTISGPNTVIRLLSRLPRGLPAAVVVVLEISSRIIGAFAQQFDELVPWKIETAGNGTVLQQGTCYLGSNDQSWRLFVNQDGEACLKTGPRVDHPLDMLFASAADTFQQNAIGLLLTGIGNDGADGLSQIKTKSGITIAQDTETCVYPNLTENAIRQGAVDMVLSERKLPRAIESVMATD